MLTKTIALGCTLAVVPLFLSAVPQDPVRTTPPRAERSDALRKRVRELEAELRRATQRAERAERSLEEVRAQLEECLDLLEQSTETRRRNCTPSRSLLTYYQWMDERGHAERAGRMLDRAVAEIGDDRNRLNGLAWDLMTDGETIGRFDRAALALVERMRAGSPQLHHRQLDTAALAMFLNGRIDEAITLAAAAVERNRGSDDYRRRLRMYEAARTAAQSAAREAAAGVAAGGGD